GFFKGTSADQDRRFSDKELKLLKSMKFPPEFDKKASRNTRVDMRKVNLSVIRPWIVKKVIELVGFEDEVVVEYAMGLLEDDAQPTPDPRRMQINLTGFLTKSTPAFMSALWKLLLEAQESPAGVPRTFVEEKKEEMRQAKAGDSRAIEERDRRVRLDDIQAEVVEASRRIVETDRVIVVGEIEAGYAWWSRSAPVNVPITPAPFPTSSAATISCTQLPLSVTISNASSTQVPLSPTWRSLSISNFSSPPTVFSATIPFSFEVPATRETAFAFAICLSSPVTR
ncbi:PWI domain-containing protein, partial [Trametes gibbosa]